MAKKQTKRRDERYSLSRSIPAEITFTDCDGNPIASGDAVDISLRGAKIELSEAPTEHGPVHIELTPNEMDTTITAVGNTCWVRPTNDAKWWLGISFDEAIDMKALDKLAALGYVDRRQDHRAPTHVALAARCELTEEISTVQLQDLSVGGLGFISPISMPLESCLLLGTTERNLEARPIVARVKWVANSDEGFKIGCSFVAKEGYPELRRQIASQLDSRWRPRAETVRYMLSLFAGAATLWIGYCWLRNA